MTGWLIVLIAALLILVVLARFARKAHGHWPLVGAAILAGLTGYAWQGRPGLPAQKAMSRADASERASASNLPVGASSALSTDGEYLGYANAMLRIGHSETAVSLLSGGVAKYPQNADLWVGLANALIIHGNGLVSPAARYAVNKARTIAPDHFGAAFLAGLTAAQDNNLLDARAIWAEMLSRSPQDAPWRADLEQRIKAIDAAQQPQLQRP